MISTAFIVSCDDTKQITDNPFLTAYDTPFGVPPFDKIKDEHFKPAYEEALRQHSAEVDSIANITEAPTFENTILALEHAGGLLTRVSYVFSNLSSSTTNDVLKALDTELAPKLAAHRDDITLNDKLFGRVKAVWDQRDSLGLDSEQLMLLERSYKNFVRNGANLNDADKATLRDVNAQLAELTTQFGQHVLAETNAFELVVDSEEALGGLSDGLKAAAANTASAKGHDGKWVFTLSNSSVMPFLQYADNRELRRQLWEGYKNRGANGNENDNSDILVEIANLRLQKANLLGYPTHAHYVLEEAMAENPDNVRKLLGDLWKPAIAKAKAEAYDIQKEIEASGQDFQAAPYDWRYYSEKIRQQRFSLSEEELKPYFSLASVRQGAFDVANKLYGLQFKQLEGMPIYHPEVEVYEVSEADGTLVGIFYVDYFPRESKRPGAWMSSFRRQYTENGERMAPVIVNVCNFTAPVGDQPALLTFDEANTLFHEFGHALHGLLSNVTYQSLSGTSVSRDFVELPSQVMENWAEDPTVLKSYAKHHETGEAIPDALIAKLESAGTFGQGFATVEYLASAILDFDYHTITSPITVSAAEFEKASMDKAGLIDEIIPRHRSTYFNHIFSGGYSAGYYSYIWAEVLDADAFAAFKETSLYDKATADAFRHNILEKGGTEKPAELYRKFRGADPDPVHLMRKRGLD
ncbi:M3 family metallopeptidase [Parapedobacter soli]|uniref:M3 family metallopeptidase n=1 Tax=Parapedobacter soli TaxID=416955 RepID=UPI0021C5DA0B|nr:M3 family metallopeptidase [Parapedobacter soli]